MRRFDSSPDEQSDYSEGECAAFAIAAVRRDGGSFLIVEDGEQVFETADVDDYRFVVVHVYALVEGPDGLVARDIFGERPETKVPDDMWEEFYVGEHLQEYFDTEEQLREYCIDDIGDGTKPLAAVTEEDIARATEVLDRICPREPEPVTIAFR